MCVYNGQAHLREAIESILSQTLQQLEFIIVDDGSTDDTLRIIDAYRHNDSRIRVYTQPNRGLSTALNVGLKLSRASFIARMDADDVSDANRLELQVKFLRDNPHIAAVGAFARFIDEDGGSRGTLKLPISFDEIRWRLMFSNVMVHPSVIIRKEALESIGGYNEAFTYAQDFELWVRLVKSGYRLGNIPEPVLSYRVHPSQVSAHQVDAQSAFATSAAALYIQFILGDAISTDLIAVVAQIFRRERGYILPTTWPTLQHLIFRICNEVRDRVPSSEYKAMTRMVARRLAHSARDQFASSPSLSISMVVLALRVRLVKPPYAASGRRVDDE
jgi:glycosyltransferase involved in cell wall biosynthesis